MGPREGMRTKRALESIILRKASYMMKQTSAWIRIIIHGRNEVNNTRKRCRKQGEPRSTSRWMDDIMHSTGMATERTKGSRGESSFLLQSPVGATTAEDVVIASYWLSTLSVSVVGVVLFAQCRKYIGSEQVRKRADDIYNTFKKLFLKTESAVIPENKVCCLQIISEWN